MSQYSVRNIKPKKRRMSMYYLTIKEKKDVMVECGDASLIMYEFYISKGGAQDYQFSDNKTANTLGWDISKAKRIRLKLEKADYIFTRTYSDKKGKFIVTYLGKDNTQHAKQPDFIDNEILVEEKVMHHE